MASYTTKRVGENPDLILNLEHNLTFADDDDINAMIERRYRLYDYLTNNDYANAMMLQSVIDQWADYIEQLYATTQYDYDPLLNYDKHEEGKETTARHKGSKRSTNISLKDSRNTDRKLATNTDIKDSTATNLTETTTPRVERVTDTTGYGLNSTTGAPVQTVTEHAPLGTDSVATSGTAAGNYTERSGNAQNNYTQETENAQNNYTERTGNAANNYETLTDIDANTYDKDELSFTDRRTYGNIGTTKTQDLIQAERDLIIEVLDVYVSKFADCFDISTDILRGWLSNHDDNGDELPDYE